MLPRNPTPFNLIAIFLQYFFMKLDLTIWAVESYRAGETSQVVGLAEGLHRALGWQVVTKRLEYSRLAGPLALLRAVSVRGITAAARQTLTPPWPDLLIVAGARNESVARWVRRASGGQTRIVFIGRTWARTRHFDLLVTTPQYRVPPAANVLENATTLHRVHPARLMLERAAWHATFAPLAPPRTVVLVGGDSGPYALRAATGRKLAAAVTAHADPDGTVLLTTSSRTHAAAAQSLTDALPDAWLYRWRPGDPANPYFGMLAWADAIVVTSDSIAMLSEALAVGVPVALFDLAAQSDATPKTRAYQWLMRLGPARLTRDIGIAHARLIAAGAMTRLGERGTHVAPAPDHTQYLPQQDALPRTIQRVAALFESST